LQKSCKNVKLFVDYTRPNWYKYICALKKAVKKEIEYNVNKKIFTKMFDIESDI
jgi:hypothetical protein